MPHSPRLSKIALHPIPSCWHYYGAPLNNDPSIQRTSTSHTNAIAYRHTGQPFPVRVSSSAEGAQGQPLHTMDVSDTPAAAGTEPPAALPHSSLRLTASAASPLPSAAEPAVMRKHTRSCNICNDDRLLDPVWQPGNHTHSQRTGCFVSGVSSYR